MGRIVAWLLGIILAVLVFINSSDADAANAVLIGKCEFDFSRDISLKNQSIELWSEEISSDGAQKKFVYSLVFVANSGEADRKAVVKKLNNGQKFQSDQGLDTVIFDNIKASDSSLFSAQGRYELSIVPPKVDVSYELNCHDISSQAFAK